jgi:hypothetical protein
MFTVIITFTFNIAVISSTKFPTHLTILDFTFIILLITVKFVKLNQSFQNVPKFKYLKTNQTNINYVQK